MLAAVCHLLRGGLNSRDIWGIELRTWDWRCRWPFSIMVVKSCENPSQVCGGQGCTRAVQLALLLGTTVVCVTEDEGFDAEYDEMRRAALEQASLRCAPKAKAVRDAKYASDGNHKNGSRLQTGPRSNACNIILSIGQDSNVACSGAPRRSRSMRFVKPTVCCSLSIR